MQRSKLKTNVKIIWDLLSLKFDFLTRYRTSMILVRGSRFLIDICFWRESYHTHHFLHLLCSCPKIVFNIFIAYQIKSYQNWPIKLTIQIITSGGTFSFLELLLASDDISDTKLFFLLLILRGFNCGLGFFGPLSSKQITKPFEASASSFSFSVLIAERASASSSVKPWDVRDLNW